MKANKVGQVVVAVVLMLMAVEAVVVMAVVALIGKWVASGRASPPEWAAPAR